MEKTGTQCSKRRIIYVVIFVKVLVIGFIYMSPWSAVYLPAMKLNYVSDADTHLRVYSILDIHDENATWGHSPSLHLYPSDQIIHHTMSGNRVVSNVSIDQTTVAIGFGLTTRKITMTKENLQTSLTMFKSFLPSFCRTCSGGYKYNFFVAYDFDDPYLQQHEFLDVFSYKFYNFIREKCTSESTYRLHFVRCNHTKSPAWAQNDAMMEAYFSNMAYYYRINDDTEMVTAGWTEAFIKTLNEMNPSNVGVVGPTHKGGNTAILTYDFVSYHHLDIFGFYYPRMYPDWHADGWITNVYMPNNSKKLKDIKLSHLMSLGQRYKAHPKKIDFLKKQLSKDQLTLMRYLRSQNNSITPTGRHVVSLSLAGKDPLDTWGAVWYAQHVTSYLPEWTLRVYIDHATEETQVPDAVINKLVLLGAQVLVIPDKMRSLPSHLWRYLVIEDDSVDVFLIRDPRTRFTERESVILNKWLNNITNSPIYCVRDHTDHAVLAIVNGLWGALRLQLLKQIHLDSQSIIEEFNAHHNRSAQEFLSDVIWPRVLRQASCFDSVSCSKWDNARPFPVLRHGGEWVGQPHDQYGMVKQSSESLPGTAHDKCNAPL